jgi:hypothetical protein
VERSNGYGNYVFDIKGNSEESKSFNCIGQPFVLFNCLGGNKVCPHALQAAKDPASSEIVHPPLTCVLQNQRRSGDVELCGTKALSNVLQRG